MLNVEDTQKKIEDILTNKIKGPLNIITSLRKLKANPKQLTITDLKYLFADNAPNFYQNNSSSTLYPLELIVFLWHTNRTLLIKAKEKDALLAAQLLKYINSGSYEEIKKILFPNTQLNEKQKPFYKNFEDVFIPLEDPYIKSSIDHPQTFGTVQTQSTKPTNMEGIPKAQEFTPTPPPRVSSLKSESFSRVKEYTSATSEHKESSVNQKVPLFRKGLGPSLYIQNKLKLFINKPFLFKRFNALDTLFPQVSTFLFKKAFNILDNFLNTDKFKKDEVKKESQKRIKQTSSFKAAYQTFSSLSAQLQQNFADPFIPTPNSSPSKPNNSSQNSQQVTYISTPPSSPSKSNNSSQNSQQVTYISTPNSSPDESSNSSQNLQITPYTPILTPPTSPEKQQPPSSMLVSKKTVRQLNFFGNSADSGVTVVVMGKNKNNVGVVLFSKEEKKQIQNALKPQ